MGGQLIPGFLVDLIIVRFQAWLTRFPNGATNFSEADIKSQCDGPLVEKVAA